MFRCRAHKDITLAASTNPAAENTLYSPTTDAPYQYTSVWQRSNSNPKPPQSAKFAAARTTGARLGQLSVGCLFFHPWPCLSPIKSTNQRLAGTDTIEADSVIAMESIVSGRRALLEHRQKNNAGRRWLSTQLDQPNHGISEASRKRLRDYWRRPQPKDVSHWGGLTLVLLRSAGWS